MERLRDILKDKNTFAIGAELVTTRGIVMQDDSAKIVPRLFRSGANIIGGCCGTNSEHIKAMSRYF